MALFYSVFFNFLKFPIFFNSQDGALGSYHHWYDGVRCCCHCYIFFQLTRWRLRFLPPLIWWCCCCYYYYYYYYYCFLQSPGGAFLFRILNFLKFPIFFNSQDGTLGSYHHWYDGVRCCCRCYIFFQLTRWRLRFLPPLIWWCWCCCCYYYYYYYCLLLHGLHTV